MINVEKRAKELGFSVEEELSNNARYMAKKNGFLEETKQGIVKDYEYYLKRIKDDEEWMVNIRIQAQEQEISVDSSLSENAHNMARKNGF